MENDKPVLFWNNNVWTDNNERKELLMTQSILLICQAWWRQCYGMGV